jgi:hypothetical protein
MLWKAEATPSSQVDQNLIQPGFFKQAFISASWWSFVHGLEPWWHGFRIVVMYSAI